MMKSIPAFLVILASFAISNTAHSAFMSTYTETRDHFSWTITIPDDDILFNDLSDFTITRPTEFLNSNLTLTTAKFWTATVSLLTTGNTDLDILTLSGQHLSRASGHPNDAPQGSIFSHKLKVSAEPVIFSASFDELIDKGVTHIHPGQNHRDVYNLSYRTTGTPQDITSVIININGVHTISSPSPLILLSLGLFIFLGRIQLLKP